MSFSPWEKKSLNDIAKRIFSGGTPSRGKKEYWEGGTIPWLKTNQIGSYKIYDTDEYITEMGLENSSARIVNKNSITIAMYGDGKTRGNVSIIAKEMATNQACCNIEVDEKIADYKFVYYFLKQHYKTLRHYSNGGAQQNLNVGFIKSFEINLPNIKEQRNISKILSSIDDKIELNNAINKNLEEMAQALFKRWFVDFEFPNENGEPYKSSGGEFVESELGLIPKGWKVGCLGDISNIRKNTLKPENIPTGTPYVGLEHITPKNLSLYNSGVSDGLESNKTVFMEMDILFGKLRPYFHKVCIAPFNGVCSTDILVIYPQIQDYYGFLIGHLFSDRLIETVTQSSNGTKMPRTKWSDIANYKVPIPDIGISARFTQLINSFIFRMQNNINESRNLSLVRDTLLPKLMSGEIRVPVDEN